MAATTLKHNQFDSSSQEKMDVDCAIQNQPAEKRATTGNYQTLQDVYDYFNKKCFNNTLPDVVLTLQRRANSLGFYFNNRFVNQSNEHIDEIALNPAYFKSDTEMGVYSTLVHEQAHLWQQQYGKPSKRGYHNREWSNKMIAIGLYPSSDGQPGGRETGYVMSHYIVQDGLFHRACLELLHHGFALPWLDDVELDPGHSTPISKSVKGTNRSNRWKYSCPHCEVNAWGKPQLKLLCGVCHVPLLPSFS